MVLGVGVSAGQAVARIVATEAKVANTVAMEVEVGTLAAITAASGGKLLLAAEDCNTAGPRSVH